MNYYNLKYVLSLIVTRRPIGVSELKEKIVAGTVMLHLDDGTKKFLMCEKESRLELAYTAISHEKTGLANILQLLKEEVFLDIANINLLELTNGQAENRNVPLFVFEAKEAEQPTDLPKDYEWMAAKYFRQVIKDFEIEGMPFF
jgi:hypothetical protein